MTRLIELIKRALLRIHVAYLGHRAAQVAEDIESLRDEFSQTPSVLDNWERHRRAILSKRAMLIGRLEGL